MSFVKYAAAMTDGKEKKKLRSLYVARIVLPIVGAAAYIAAAFLASLLIVGAVLSSYYGRHGDPEQDMGGGGLSPVLTASYWGSLILYLAALGCVVAFVAVSVSFFVRVRRLIRRPAAEGEPVEVVEYRKKLAAYKNAEIKDISWSFFAFSAGSVVFVIMNVVAMFFYRDIFSVASVLFVSFIVMRLIVIAVFSREHSSEARDLNIAARQTVGIDTSHEMRWSSGEKDEFTLYVYPSYDLLNEVKRLKKTSKKRFLIVLAVSAAVAVVSAAIDIRWFAQSFLRYLLSLLLIGSFLAEHFALRPFEKKKKALDETARAMLVSDEKYGLNLKLFDKYSAFSKRSRIVMTVSCIVSAALSVYYALAHVSYVNYLLCLAIVVVAFLVRDLTYIVFLKSIIPIEREIDEITAPQKAQTLSAEPDDLDRNELD